MKLGGGWLVVAGWGLGLVVVAGGCSSSDDAATSVNREQFPQEYARAYCSAIKPCCDRAKVPQVMQECVNALQGSLEISFAGYDSRLVYHADAAGRCVRDVAAQLAGCGPTSVIPELTAECPGVFTGTAPVAAACSYVDGDLCQSNYCQNNVCIEAPRGTSQAKLGEACDGDCWVDASGEKFCDFFGSSVCDNTAGLTCAGSGAAGGDFVCAAMLPIGQACQSGTCVEGAYCANDGLCQPRIAVDSGPCRQAPQACVKGAFCDEGLERCIALSDDGRGCTVDHRCKSGSCIDYICAPRSIADELMCSGAWRR